MATASITVPSRRIVRRRARPTFAQAYDIALAELPIEIRPLVIRYIDNMREGQEIRLALSTDMTRIGGVRWYDIDGAVRSLLS